MKIVFFGNPDFCIPSLDKLNKYHNIVTVVTNIDRKAGRGLKINSTSVKIHSKRLELSVVEFNGYNWDSIKKSLSIIEADLFIVIAFSIIPDEILSLPKYGCLNIHPSILPKYRGSSPIQYALMNGDKETGVSIININKKIDSGDIFGQEFIIIKKNDTFGTLYDKLSLIGANLLIEVIDKISNNKLIPIVQNHKNRTLAPKINKEDLIINWNNNANYINNKIKAFDPHPGAFTFFEGKRIKLFESKLFESIESIVSLENNGDFIFKDGLIFIKCVKNYLSVNSVQLEGKKRISSIDFCNNL